jgi:hypothetical protein
MRDEKLKLSPRFKEFLPGLSARELASCVQKLSDFYLAHPGKSTPWNEPWARPATLSYFMPLNSIRMMRAFKEVERFLPQESLSEVWDFGSGLGTTHWVLEDQEWLSPRPLYSLEVSREAEKHHLELQQRSGARWKSEPRREVRPAKGALAVFSYSFLEMQKALPRLEAFDHWLIVEPSTRECGRALMEWRSKFIAAGFEPLAPCTHSHDCPLLVHSPRDWCHHRVHFEQPEWFQEIEDLLPMKNHTLTFSYLLVSRTVRDKKWRDAIRVIGDTLEEKGKTRQLVCRGPNREFFSWLHRNGSAPHIPHGTLMRIPENVEVKSAEIRLPADFKQS